MSNQLGGPHLVVWINEFAAATGREVFVNGDGKYAIEAYSRLVRTFPKVNDARLHPGGTPRLESVHDLALEIRGEKGTRLATGTE